MDRAREILEVSLPIFLLWDSVFDWCECLISYTVYYLPIIVANVETFSGHF